MSNQYNSSIGGKKKGSRIIAYDQDEDTFQIFDTAGVQIENNNLYSTKTHHLIGGIKNYQINNDNVFAVITKEASALEGGAKKRRRSHKMINLSSLSPEVAAYFTYQPEIDNRLLQHTTYRFKQANGIDQDTEINYDFINGGAKKTSRKKAQTRKAAKKAFGMEKEDVVNLTEDIVNQNHVLNTKLTFNDNVQLHANDSILQVLSNSIQTSSLEGGSSMVGGARKSRCQACDCEADQLWDKMFQVNVEAEPQQAAVEPTVVEAQPEQVAEIEGDSLTVGGAKKKKKSAVKKVEEDSPEENNEASEEKYSEDENESSNESENENNNNNEDEEHNVINYFA